MFRVMTMRHVIRMHIAERSVKNHELFSGSPRSNLKGILRRLLFGLDIVSALQKEG